MGSDSAEKSKIIHLVSSQFSAEQELKLIRKKYDDLCAQMDEILMETMERSNRIVMETEISNLIMSQVFNASNDGIWAVDRNYKVIRINKKLLDLLGRPAADVIGKKCYELFSEECRGAAKCPMNKILNGERVVEQERTLTFDSGHTIPFMVTFTPLSDLDVSTIGLVETYTDISERKHHEKRLQLANQELEKLATEDPLTRLANRRRLDEYLDQEWRRQARARNQISLIMCDVDFFKKYNDQYGHQAGDACLKAVAEVIRKKVRRPSDLIARYGGEEFAVIMPETNLKGAWFVAESVRQELVRKRIPHCQSLAAQYVTISCGIASIYPRMYVTPKTLIERADKSLYKAKQQGRNRIVAFEEPK
jgi:diguanylate cyclase (GGDEF)-like protein/PAS domain S-box-containing protein